MTEAMWAATIGAGVGAVLGVLSAWWAGLCSSQAQHYEESAGRQAELSRASASDAYAEFERARAMAQQAQAAADRAAGVAEWARGIEGATRRLQVLRRDEEFDAMREVVEAEAARAVARAEKAVDESGGGLTNPGVSRRPVGRIADYVFPEGPEAGEPS